DVVFEVRVGGLHLLHDAHERSLGIILRGVFAQRAKVPSPILGEVIYPEWLVGYRCEHGTMARAVIHHEGFVSAAPFHVVLFSSPDMLAVPRGYGDQHA